MCKQSRDVGVMRKYIVPVVDGERVSQRYLICVWTAFLGCFEFLFEILDQEFLLFDLL